MSDKPNFVVVVGKLSDLTFRTGSYGEYATFSIKQGKHWTSCICSGMVSDALKMAVENAKVSAYGVQKEKTYKGKDGTEKISISVNVYAITLEAKDKSVKETVDHSQVLSEIPNEPTMSEDDLPF